MDLSDRLTLSYFRHLVSSPKGRTHVLNQVADAEDNGEQAIFDRALAHVDDPELARMIRKHKEDEVRHARLFRERLATTGIAAPPVPSHLKMLDRLDRALGGFFDKPIDDERGVMEAYLLLQVIEERACTLFPVFEQGFRGVDAATADVFAEVARDEERHLLYCRAIAKRYAPSREVHDATLARMRAVEARCFVENSNANMRHCMDHDLIDLGPAARFAWLTVSRAASVVQPARPTRFWETPPRRSLWRSSPAAA